MSLLGKGSVAITVKVIRKSFQVLSWIVLIFLLVGAVLMLGTRPFGLTPFVVLNGGMDSAYPVGSVIYVKAVEPGQVQIGDAITFVLNEELEVATLRVVGIDVETKHFHVIGDNITRDGGESVYFENLLGTPQFTIPKLGFIAHAIATPPGNLIAIILTAVFVTISSVLDATDPKHKKESSVNKTQLTSQEKQDNSTTKLMGIATGS